MSARSSTWAADHALGRARSRTIVTWIFRRLLDAFLSQVIEFAVQLDRHFRLSAIATGAAASAQPWQGASALTAASIEPEG
jgi:hypothetical protein